MAITVRLNEKNSEFLDIITSKTHKPKSFFINEALDEYLEDRLDYLEACEILAKSREEDLVSWEDVKAEHGI